MAKATVLWIAAALLIRSVTALPSAVEASSYTDALKDLQKKGATAFDAQLAKSTTCTKDKMMVRKEWGDLTATERTSYIAAVQCLLKAPSKLSATQFPGAKSRYDDFVVVHMQQTMSIHGTGSFLSWHRYYTWAYEQALRTECGYTGAQPFWDWGRWADDPEKSPIFDGSDTSISSNGEKVAHTGGGFNGLPVGNGGGCVKTGPFKNMTVHLGPVSNTANPAPKANPRSDGYGDNPRCLRRDISNILTKQSGKTSDITRLITSSADIGTFQNSMQAGNGVHNVGHFTIAGSAGDPSGDFYISPGDPAFWLHHAMIDRTWQIWQLQDYTKRLQVISGGTSMMGGGRAQSLEDNVDLTVVASKVYKIKELVSIVDGPFCYTYDV